MREAVDEHGLDLALEVVRDDHGEDEALDAAGDEGLSVDIRLAEEPHERVDDQRSDLGDVSRARLVSTRIFDEELRWSVGAVPVCPRTTVLQAVEHQLSGDATPTHRSGSRGLWRAASRLW